MQGLCSSTAVTGKPKHKLIGPFSTRACRERKAGAVHAIYLFDLNRSLPMHRALRMAPAMVDEFWKL